MIYLLPIQCVFDDTSNGKQNSSYHSLQFRLVIINVLHRHVKNQALNEDALPLRIYLFKKIVVELKKEYPLYRALLSGWVGFL